jgi:hypothetical protein
VSRSAKPHYRNHADASVSGGERKRSLRTSCERPPATSADCSIPDGPVTSGAGARLLLADKGSRAQSSAPDTRASAKAGGGLIVVTDVLIAKTRARHEVPHLPSEQRLGLRRTSRSLSWQLNRQVVGGRAIASSRRTSGGLSSASMEAIAVKEPPG